MKKVFALMAIAAMFAVSCSKDDDKDSSVALKGISLSQTTLALEEGQDATLTVTLSPENTTEKPTITWASDKEAVATVVGGKVTAVAAGEANITATAGKFTATCKVTVTAKASDDPKPVEGTSDWSVIGALLGTNWDTDFVMAQNGNIFVLKNVKLAAADKFKIRYQKNWDVNRGGVFAALGEGFEVVDKGADIAPGLDGIYDIYYNADVEKMAVVAKDGTPAWGAAAASITIDGDFADWAALAAGTFSQTYGDEDATHPALTHAKVYADAEKVYVYVEWDMEYIEDTSWVPFHCYINTDGNEATGGYADQFSDACSDILLEGAVYADGEVCSYWSGGYPWIGEANASGWGWAPDTDNVFPDDSPTEGAGVDGKYEFSIDRQMFAAVGFPFADVFSIGFDIQQNWSSVGILPNAAPTEDNAAGVVASLKVTTQK